ncbi:MAG: hypothetical protein J0J06_06035 [Sphingomonas sp.]|uniref:hypothetical protein n=1 Tax=Sphingomonas sp. TaxID=28214 RepID=UPI001AD54FF5|nr:hypothetical protein [Sphingomonas sp.]MBN8814990.1 hypothetical protein [Sphingomonas sp.]
MKSMILIAAAPVLLAGCKASGTADANTASTANASAPEVVPDSVTVNGVTYVRAGLDKISPASAPAPIPTPAASPSSTPPPAMSDTGSSVPPNSGTGGAAADHEQ